MAINLNIDSILKLEMPKKVALLLAVNGLIGAFFYYFMTMPKYDEIEKHQRELDKVTVTLNEKRMIANDIPRFQKEKEVLERKLELALTKLPNKKEIPDIINSISDAGKGAGLRISLFRPLPERPKDFYAEVPVEMNVQGSYGGLFDFASKVAKFSRIMNIQGIVISTVGQNNRIPLLDAKFNVLTFRFIEQEQEDLDEKRGKGGKKRRKK